MIDSMMSSGGIQQRAVIESSSFNNKNGRPMREYGSWGKAGDILPLPFIYATLITPELAAMSALAKSVQTFGDNNYHDYNVACKSSATSQRRR